MALVRSDLVAMEVPTRIAAPARAAGRGRVRGAPGFQPVQHPLPHRLHRFRRPALVSADDAVLVTDGRYATQAPSELALSGAPARGRGPAPRPGRWSCWAGS